MNQRGQIAYGIIAFVVVAIGLFIIAPIVLNVVRSSIGGVADAVNSTHPQASTAGYYVRDSFTNLWDWVILLAFTINVVILLISAFLIDTHPVFVVLYILTLFFLFMFAPSMIDIVNETWSQPAFATETGLYLDGTSFLVEHFSTVLFAIAILSGVVLYAKIKMFPSY